MTETAQTNPPSNGKAKRRPGPRALPALTVDVTLSTAFAQRVFNRVWDRLKGDIFVLTVRSRSAGLEDVGAAAETVIKEQFDAIREDLAGELSRADHLIDQLGITSLGQYDGALTVAAEFTTPQAKRYLDLVLSLDQYIMRVDALWLNGEIETKQRTDRSYEWQRRMIKTANRIRQLSSDGRRTIEQAQQARQKTRPDTDTEPAVNEDATAPTAPTVPAEAVDVEDATAAAAG